MTVLSRDDYLDGWAALHGGYDARANVLVRWWLSRTYDVARPLSGLRVPPDLVTAAGVLVAVWAASLAAASGRWPLLAAAAVVVSGLLDGLDGALAVVTGRASRWGFVLDSVADRVSDTAYLVALWWAGAPGALCATGGVLMFLQEFARARAGAAGLAEVVVLTVAERPTRVVVTAAFLMCTGLFLDGRWSLFGAAAWSALGAVGLVQLLVVVRRRLLRAS